jgi:hypothetical protein
LILEAPLIVHQQQFFDPLSTRLGFHFIYFKSRRLVLPLHKISRACEKRFKSCILKNHGQLPLLPRPTGVWCNDPMGRGRGTGPLWAVAASCQRPPLCPSVLPTVPFAPVAPLCAPVLHPVQCDTRSSGEWGCGDRCLFWAREPSGSTAVAP